MSITWRDIEIGARLDSGHSVWQVIIISSVSYSPSDWVMTVTLQSEECTPAPRSFFGPQYLEPARIEILFDADEVYEGWSRL